MYPGNKKKGLTKEEEEELRRKQATLFQSDHSHSMNPNPGNNNTDTPTFPSANLSMSQPQMYQPSDPAFYDGSITQVLQNPSINPNFQQQQTMPPQTPQQQTQEDIEVQAVGEESKEAMDTHPSGTDMANLPTLQGSRGKQLCLTSLGVSVTEIPQARHPEHEVPVQVVGQDQIAQHDQMAAQHNMDHIHKEKRQMEEEEEDFE
jgi:hypothetical protein